MKAVDVIGRSNVELKEFQHSAEILFEKQAQRIEGNVLQTEYDAGIASLREQLEARMESELTILKQEMETLTKRTYNRLDKFDKKLTRVEADTVWKINEYEKLLEARPTLQYVKSAMVEEARNVLCDARVYTDTEFAKLKAMLANLGTASSAGVSGDFLDEFSEFKEKTESTIDSLQRTS